MHTQPAHTRTHTNPTLRNACAILAEDSDFLIYASKPQLMLSSVVITDRFGSPAIAGTLMCPKDLAEFFCLPLGFMPLFATLCGNGSAENEETDFLLEGIGVSAGDPH